jgi:hypothetical protein
MAPVMAQLIMALLLLLEDMLHPSLACISNGGEVQACRHPKDFLLASPHSPGIASSCQIHIGGTTRLPKADLCGDG